MHAPIVIGTAGWSLSRTDQESFPPDGTHLERYAAAFDGAEINASFHRPLRRELYEKWASAVPGSFSFSVKVPRTITHDARLEDVHRPLAAFLDQAAGLGAKHGCVLVQLPPSLAYDAQVAGDFLATMRALHRGPVVLEPRHPTWFGHEAARLLANHGVARVAADPARVPEAAVPGADARVVYYRLHGSPRIYWSAYAPAYLDRLAAELVDASRTAEQVWCIFDNTASGAAIPDAMALVDRVDALMRQR